MKNIEIFCYVIPFKIQLYNVHNIEYEFMLCEANFINFQF